MDYLQQLDSMFDSKHRLVSIETEDPARVIDLISQLSRFSNKAYYLSRPGHSMHRFGSSHIEIPRTSTPMDIMSHIDISRHFGVYILQDFHPELKNHQILAEMKEIVTGDIDKTIVLLSERIDLPNELKPYTLRSKHKLRDAS